MARAIRRDNAEIDNMKGFVSPPMPTSVFFSCLDFIRKRKIAYGKMQGQSIRYDAVIELYNQLGEKFLDWTDFEIHSFLRARD
jgi:hypothetical protein